MKPPDTPMSCRFYSSLVVPGALYTNLRLSVEQSREIIAGVNPNPDGRKMENTAGIFSPVCPGEKTYHVWICRVARLVENLVRWVGIWGGGGVVGRLRLSQFTNGYFAVFIYHVIELPACEYCSRFFIFPRTLRCDICSPIGRSAMNYK